MNDVSGINIDEKISNLPCKDISKDTSKLEKNSKIILIRPVF